MDHRYEQLFVYGTLKPGGRNYSPIERMVHATRNATIEGVLIDRGRSPGLTEGSGLVRGVVLTVEPQALTITDRIENFRPGDDDSLYIRRKVQARIDDNRMLDCWTYYFADPSAISDGPRCIVDKLDGIIVHAWPYGEAKSEPRP